MKTIKETLVEREEVHTKLLSAYNSTVANLGKIESELLMLRGELRILSHLLENEKEVKNGEGEKDVKKEE